MSGLAQALIYGLGGYLALQGQLDAGTVVTLALLLNRLYAPLTALATARLDVVTALVSFERVFEVLDIEPLIAEAPDAVAVPDGPVVGRARRRRFGYPSADRVSLASLEEVAVLDDRAERARCSTTCPFRVEPGQTVALVGPSGAGKSTIASLVPRLYDVDAGAVRLGGVDVARPVVRLDPRRRSASSPRTATCSTTRSGPTSATPRPTPPTTSCGTPCEQARLAALVASLPDGLDTVVGERGYRLSGGERQRLTIARLLLAKPRVVILDEATAHLDSESEAAVQEALAAALDGRTALVIAHRLSTVRAADAILVIEDGRVVERGTHAELLAAGRPLRRPLPHAVRRRGRGGLTAHPSGGPRRASAPATGSRRRRRRRGRGSRSAATTASTSSDAQPADDGDRGDRRHLGPRAACPARLGSRAPSGRCRAASAPTARTAGWTARSTPRR